MPLLLATSNEQLDGSAGGSSDPAGVQPASLVGAGDMERSHSEAVNGANGIPIVPASEPPMSSLHAVGSGTASPPEDSGGSRISFPPSLNRWLTQTTVLQEDTRSTDSRSPRPVSTVVSEKELEAASPVWDDVTKESKTADRILYADASATMLLPEKSASNASGVDPHKLQTMNSPSDANLTPGTPSVPKTTAVHARDSQKNAKLLYLEGLRGIAALVVAVHHYKQGSFRNVGFWWAEESFHRYLWHILWDGTFSVTVFYVLSGRVLTAAFYARKGPIQALSSAVIRRPFRLAIPVAMAMAINLILGYSGAYDLTARAARIMHSGDWLVNANKYYLIKNAGDYFIALVNMVCLNKPFTVGST